MWLTGLYWYDVQTRSVIHRLTFSIDDLEHNITSPAYIIYNPIVEQESRYLALTIWCRKTLQRSSICFFHLLTVIYLYWSARYLNLSYVVILYYIITFSVAIVCGIVTLLPSLDIILRLQENSSDKDFWRW